MSEKLLTVVVAAYNCSATLNRIFEHLTACERLDKLEVVIVNDGSKDDTSAVAHRYADQYPTWVRVVDKANGGHGSALSAGFRVAQGRYCRPLDGDDWLDEHGLDALLDRLDQCDADMIVSDVETKNLDADDSVIKSWELPAEGSFTVADLVPLQYLPGYHAIIFATKILKEIPELDHHCFYVDNEYNVYPLSTVKKAVYYPKTVYVHTVGNGEQSTSIQSLIKNRGNLQTVFFSLMRYAAQHEDNTAAVTVAHRFACSQLITFTAVTFIIDPKEGKSELHAMYVKVRDRYPDFYRTMDITRTGRLYRALHLHGYGLIRLLVNAKHKGDPHIIW
ncbi:MAG TPA: glycosyltransferase [Bifidobacterium pseudolongum subsp. globosum]|nr:glycosyltransferase [Bifidobacterium pseudolongum subsp. globosum]